MRTASCIISSNQAASWLYWRADCRKLGSKCSFSTEVSINNVVFSVYFNLPVDNREQLSDTQPGSTNHNVETGTSPCFLYSWEDGFARRPARLVLRQADTVGSTPPRSHLLPRLAHCTRRAGVETGTSPCFILNVRFNPSPEFLNSQSSLRNSTLSHKGRGMGLSRYIPIYFNVRKDSINYLFLFFKPRKTNK